MVAVGSIYWYASETIPLGFLKCDGSQVSRTDYQNLFNVIGVVFGSGDGSSTFGLPNLQASFIRGDGSQNGYNATFGQVQQSTAVAGYVNYSLAISVSNSDKTSSTNVSRYLSTGSGFSSGYKTSYYIRPYNTALTPIIKY